MHSLKMNSFPVIRVLLLLMSMMVTSSFTSAQKSVFKVLTYNIRLATPGDAPNTWDARKEKVFSLIRSAEPDIFGLQEALHEQVADMQKAFPGYTRVGVGRDDGKESGEYSPLFFDTRKYKLLSSGTFWLSQTPSVAGSRGWDAACNRVVSWIELKEQNSKSSFFVFCTHFDHMGEVARRNSAKLILHAVDSLSGNKPAIIMGDFNAKPGSEPYQIITDKSNPRHLTDSRVISKTPKGPAYTYTGFKVNAQPGDQIDYIFLKGITIVESYNVNTDNNGEYYPSDHLPVNVKLQF